MGTFWYFTLFQVVLRWSGDLLVISIIRSLYGHWPEDSSFKEVRLPSARAPSVTWMAENLCRQIISLIAFLAEQQSSEVNP